MNLVEGTDSADHPIDVGAGSAITLCSRSPEARIPRGFDRQGIGEYLKELQVILGLLDADQISSVIERLLAAYRAKRSIFIFGNGGSASTATHFACDLGKNVTGPGEPRFRVMALTDNIALLTAWANDTTYDRVFEEQLANFVAAGDVVIGISASGKSPNVLRAMAAARAAEATTIGFIGNRGGDLVHLCDLSVIVACDRADQIEDAHLALQHLICRSIRRALVREREIGPTAREAIR